MSIGYTQIVGEFTRPLPNTADEERLPLAGLEFEFRADLTPAVVTDSATKHTIPLEPITAKTDEAGVLRREGDDPRVILLSSDSSTVHPAGWTYTVTVSRDGIPFLWKTFATTSGTTLDFSDIIEVPESAGEDLAAWTAAVGVTTAARDETIAARDEVRELIEGFEPGEGGGGPGVPGASAYELAVANGFDGTEVEWLESLKADGGGPGPSAYDVAVENGFAGTEIEWLADLKGEQGDDGASAYDVAVRNGFAGTEGAWLASLKGVDAIGDDGASAYQVAVANGFVGTEAAWLASLTGDDGASAYQVAVADGFSGTPSAWLASLIGPKGDSVRIVFHGSDAAHPRPNTTASVIWIGDVEPVAFDDDRDIWGDDSETSEPAPAFTGAFDTFAQPYRAHSLRRTRSAYAGKAIRVRRSSDNTETDIGFTTAGDLDTTTLLAFVGSGSAYVTTWYDQSGNARDFTQTTAAAQPRIVNAGVIDTVNGKPAVIFDGTDDYMTSGVAGLFAATTATVAAVMKSNSSAVANAALLSESRTANNNGFWRPLRGASANWNVQATDDVGGSLWASTATGSNVFDLAQHQLFYAEAAGFINTWKDNGAVHAALAAARGGATSPVRTGLGAHAGSSVSNFYNGAVQELVAWPTNETASRAAIQTAQKTYFGTP